MKTIRQALRRRAQWILAVLFADEPLGLPDTPQVRRRCTDARP